MYHITPAAVVTRTSPQERWRHKFWTRCRYGETNTTPTLGPTPGLQKLSQRCLSSSLNAVGDLLRVCVGLLITLTKITETENGFEIKVTFSWLSCLLMLINTGCQNLI